MMSRREALSVVGRGSVAGLLVGTAVVAIQCGSTAAPANPSQDPFVGRMAIYEEEIAAFEAAFDEGEAVEPSGAFCDEIRSGKLAIGNVEGAILALRRTKAIDCIIDTEGDVLVDAVIAFLEGVAAS